jgi:4-carboxymuconolactone decarboxylase
MQNMRYEKGMKIMNRVMGESGSKTRHSLKKTAPDFERLLVEFPFGEIYCRPELDLKSRELATIAMLAALGYATPQLKVHLRAALNLGWTQVEVIEILMQVSVYAGFPAALNAIQAADDVFKSEKKGGIDR